MRTRFTFFFSSYEGGVVDVISAGRRADVCDAGAGGT